MLVIFSLLFVSGGVLVEGAHHLKLCQNVTTFCTADSACNTTYQKFTQDCAWALTGIYCTPSCIKTFFGDLAANPIGKAFLTCDCHDDDPCNSLKDQCANCSARIATCQNTTGCGAKINQFFAACNTTGTTCNPACSASFKMLATAYPFLSDLPNCVCGNFDDNALCERVKGQTALCLASKPSPTKGPTATKGAGATKQDSSGTKKPTGTKEPSAAPRSVAFVALVLGIVAGVLLV